MTKAPKKDLKFYLEAQVFARTQPRGGLTKKDAIILDYNMQKLTPACLPLYMYSTFVDYHDPTVYMPVRAILPSHAFGKLNLDPLLIFDPFQPFDPIAIKFCGGDHHL